MQKDHPLRGCRWIGTDPDCPSPVICRSFPARKPLLATLHITGLGYFHAEINGQSVTDHRFQPVVSEYGPRDLMKFAYPLKDLLQYRIYYCSYDVTELLKEDNRLSIRLGNGFYRQEQRLAEGMTSYSHQLRTIYCLELCYEDRTERICSDGTECWEPGQILRSDLFLGELWDLRRKDGKQQPVRLLEDTVAPLCPQIGTPDRVIRVLEPRLLGLQGNLRIYDAGENITGLVRLTVDGKPGERVRLCFAENLTPEGALDFETTGISYTCACGEPQLQADECICGDEEAVFEPLFCWHGFRYFSLEGPGKAPQVLVIHSDAAQTAFFHSDSEGLNFLFDAFLRTQRNNMHGSFPSDCPHRERLGYTGDGQVAAAAAMQLLDCREFYRKWNQDILDTQDTVTGHTQHTAPLGGGGGGPVGWGGAIVVVPYRYFKEYGDLSLLENSWEPIQKWLKYLKTRMEEGLVAREEEGGWCLGDWATPGPVEIPEPLVNTCLLIRYLDMLLETAPLLGKQEDMASLRQLQSLCRDGIVKQYFDPVTGSFCGGVQGADAYGLYAGLGDRRTALGLIQRYERLGHFDTGFIGTDVLVDVLMDLGAADTAYKLLTSEEMGSFLYMKRRGATTLWENWNGQGSQDHPMMGSCLRHVFSGFLGIRQGYGTGGYADVRFQPMLPEGVCYMEGSLLTAKGPLRVTLRREDGRVLSDLCWEN